MVVEIPGFYYDTEKKRYFKIVPNHHRVSVPTTSSSSSAGQTLPNYHIQRVREERERERRLLNREKKAKVKPVVNRNSLTLFNNKLLNNRININSNTLSNKQLELSKLNYKRTIFRGVRGICKINGNSTNTLIGFNNGYLKLINNLNNLELNFNLGHSQSNVNSINFINNNNLIICTQKGGERKSGSLHVLHYNQSNNTHEFRQLYQNSVPNSMLYNSCYNKNLIAIGCDKFVQLYNLRESGINFNLKFNLNSNKTVYSLKFDPFERDILFCGLRSGHLQLLDCRDRSYITEFSPLKGVNYSIVDLFPLSFNGIGNQVITVGSDGTVLRLDLRKRGIHFPILGHTADIQTPNFGTYLSEDESILALAGKEGCVRFWDPIDGQLLLDPKTIQFPNLVKSLYSLNSKDFGKWMFLQDNLIQEYSSYTMPPIIP